VSSAQGDICVRFGQRLRKLRLERGWTQTDVAVHLGMDRSFLSDLERGKREPCLRTLEVIAQGFQLTVPQLLSRV
jgi:transcriptional regulator with XRE-family HTH domain